MRSGIRKLLWGRIRSGVTQKDKSQFRTAWSKIGKTCDYCYGAGLLGGGGQDGTIAHTVVVMRGWYPFRGSLVLGAAQTIDSLD